MSLFLLSLLIFGCEVIGLVPVAQAEFHGLPPSLAPTILSETVPTAFAPNDFTAADFELEWIGRPIPGVTFYLGRNSLQWVRVVDFLVLPRAQLILNAENVEAGHVSNGGFTQPMMIEGGKGSVKLPIALLSGEKNPIYIAFQRTGKAIEGQLKVKFHPVHTSDRARIYYDHSCSSFRVNAEAKGYSGDKWMFVGCRMAYINGAEYRTASLEIFVYWDGVGQIVKVGGVDTSSQSLSVWPLRLPSYPGKLTLQSDSQEIKLSYYAPEHLNLAFLGMGIGPYSYTVLDGGGPNVQTIAPVLTVYGSYFISESARLVAFDASGLQARFYTDFGIYVNNESARVLDRRLSINLMLGAHVIGFKALGQYYFRVGAPQGVEFIYRDAFLRAHNFSCGAFIYPSIAGKQYYNMWLRWGSRGFFGEFNYIAWQEKLSDERLYSRSVGFSLGFPIGYFF